VNPVLSAPMNFGIVTGSMAKESRLLVIKSELINKIIKLTEIKIF